MMVGSWSNSWEEFKCRMQEAGYTRFTIKDQKDGYELTVSEDIRIANWPAIWDIASLMGIQRFGRGGKFQHLKYIANFQTGTFHIPKKTVPLTHEVKVVGECTLFPTKKVNGQYKIVGGKEYYDALRQAGVESFDCYDVEDESKRIILRIVEDRSRGRK